MAHLRSIIQEGSPENAGLIAAARDIISRLNYSAWCFFWFWHRLPATLTVLLMMTLPDQSITPVYPSNIVALLSLNQLCFLFLLSYSIASPLKIRTATNVLFLDAVSQRNRASFHENSVRHNVLCFPLIFLSFFFLDFCLTLSRIAERFLWEYK